jgi:hypothetical protein
MMKRLRVSVSTRAYMERKLSCVAGRRAGAPDADAVARLLAEMRSPDERVRAQAVRQVCPCHVSWDVFAQMRKTVQGLQHDPSPLVRANARHVEEDAREIAALEALREWVMEHEADVEEAAHRPQRRGRRWKTAEPSCRG